MNKLQKQITYLIGPIDRCPDSGITWRKEITPFLKNLGVTVFNPNDKPFLGMNNEDSNSRKAIDVLKKQRKLKEIRELYSDIRTCDLRMVDKADFLIARIDTSIHMVGTYEEIVTANRQKKPILCHLVNGIEDCPNWLIFMLPHQFLFNSIEDLKQYLINVNDGKEATLGRWYFYR